MFVSYLPVRLPLRGTFLRDLWMLLHLSKSPDGSPRSSLHWLQHCWHHKDRADWLVKNKASCYCNATTRCSNPGFNWSWWYWYNKERQFGLAIPGEGDRLHGISILDSEQQRCWVCRNHLYEIASSWYWQHWLPRNFWNPWKPRVLPSWRTINTLWRQQRLRLQVQKQLRGLQYTVKRRGTKILIPSPSASGLNSIPCAFPAAKEADNASIPMPECGGNTRTAPGSFSAPSTSRVKSSKLCQQL